MMVGSEITPI
jgi:magnesium-transporting ATPase (P-type)